LAATRFATSKLKQLQDFDSLSTFGFRGEALASVSLVSRLSICSRTPESNIGYFQNYQNGKPLLPTSKPQARAIGTTVSVKDLFYNLPLRQGRNEREEYQRVLQVVQAYAIHKADSGISLVCRHKTSVDLNTTTLVAQTKEGATQRVLQHVFGSKIHFASLACEETSESDCTYSCKGWISTTPQKRASLILFVNDRLVECPPLKKLVAEIMGSPSVLYLSICIPPTHVDVNVHPTKKQVTLLYQDEILNGIQTSLQTMNKSREQTFAAASVESKKPVTNPYNQKKKRKAESLESTNAPARPKLPTVTPNHMVRTTRAAPSGALEPYLVKRKTNNNNKKHVPSCPLSDLSTPGAFAQPCSCPMWSTARMIVRPKRVIPTICTYRSIQSLRKKLWKYSQTHSHVSEMLKNAVWVGQVSQSQQCLVQCNVELWMWNVCDLAQQLFYQLALLQFGGLQAAVFKSFIDVTKIMAYAMELEECGDEDSADMSDSDESSSKSTNWELASQAATCLMEHAEMLDEYFSIRLYKDGDTVYLTALPILLEGYEPLPGGLSVFLLRLATEVNWNEEKPCFHGICRELGHYYAVLGKETSIQHTLFPAISFLLTPTPQVEASMRKLTVLSNLYKAFER